MKINLMKKALVPVVGVAMISLFHGHTVLAASDTNTTTNISANKVETSNDVTKDHTDSSSKQDITKTKDSKTEDKVIQKVALQVINGSYGSGSDRKDQLKKDGYDPAVVQAMVNDILHGKVNVDGVKVNKKRSDDSSSSNYQSSPNSKRELRKKIESGGNYNTFTGNGYLGAYQFAPSTWNGLCSQTGTDPNDFSPAHQDQMADLYAQQRYGGWANVPSHGGW